MALEVNEKSQNHLKLSSSSIRDQWRTYKKKYKEAKKFENITGAGLTKEDESKGIKSMSENIQSMCPCYAEMDALFGKKPNVTPIVSHDSQEKESLNGVDYNLLLYKENNCLESPHNLYPLLNNSDDLVQVENLQDESQSKSIKHSTQKHNQAMTPNLHDKSGSRKCLLDMFAPTYADLLKSQKKAHEASDNACLEWDRKRWNEEKVSNMENQWFEEFKLQKKMEFDEKQHTNKH
ncbi:hypothetical protein O181_085430 [Austropuccinia psidii MF-1]|uniref:Uncharacterized protein n=1 Tax=Austropuccinia psidii MF-1 TaxID=1389203 RepID=A0A9Q3FS75_9BASI|nr:hypothetical protein [Austropuccinia psidii MF-1]